MTTGGRHGLWEDATGWWQKYGDCAPPRTAAGVGLNDDFEALGLRQLDGSIRLRCNHCSDSKGREGDEGQRCDAVVCDWMIDIVLIGATLSSHKPMSNNTRNWDQLRNSNGGLHTQLVTFHCTTAKEARTSARTRARARRQYQGCNVDLVVVVFLV